MSFDKLFPYQKEGTRWLAEHPRRHLLLADEMGLGKTPQSIAAADIVGANRILVICPAVAKDNWAAEFGRWSIMGRPVFVQRGKESPLPPRLGACVVVCSFEYATTYREVLTLEPWDLVIVDEAHFVNNATAQRTKAIYGKGGLIHRAHRFWALTGTPTPNHWGELWVMLRCFGHTSLSYEDFLSRFCVTYPTNWGLKVVRGKESMAEELRRILGRFMLRRKKMDVLKELPPITFSETLVEPGPVDFEVEASLIQYVFPQDRKHEFFERIKREEELVRSIIDMAKLGQDGMTALAGVSDSVSTLRRYVGLQKVKPVADMIKEELKHNAYDKVVIFAIHQGVIEGLRVALKEFKPLTLYGKTPEDKRASHIKKFQNIPKYRVFIANIKAAGTAITLTAAHHVVFAEQEWSPDHNAQAAMRCHRIGQKAPVFVRFVALANSFDQKIANVLKRKTDDRAAILD